MGLCFSSPDKKELLEDSRELVESNARVLSVCVELAEGDVQKAVERVYDAVKYMMPSALAQVAQLDKKISSLAGDLKIVLSKGKERAELGAPEVIEKLDVAIAERNSYTK